MRKLISGIVLLLLLVLMMWAGASYWFGVKTEEHYHTLLQQVSQARQAQYFKVVNESYDRGFFASKARTVVEVEHPLMAAQEMAPMRFVLEHDIAHGPLPFGSRSPEGERHFRPLMAVIETRIILSEDIQSRLKELLNQTPDMTSMRNYTLVHFDGSGESHLVVPGFQHVYGDMDKVTTDWKGLFAQVNFTADLKRFIGSVRIPGLEVSGKDLDLKIEEIKHTFNVQEGARGLWIGEAAFDAPGLDFAAKENTETRTFLIRGLSLNTSAKASEESCSYSLSVQTDQVKLDESQYGPANLKMEIRNLDAASMARLQQNFGDVETAGSQHSPEEVQRRVLARYLEILPALIHRSPELEISQLDVKTPYGDFSGTAKVAVDGTKWDSSQDLSKIATILTANMACKAGEDLVKRLASSMMMSEIRSEMSHGVGKGPGDKEIEVIASALAEKQLQALTMQNVLVRENGSYTVNASYNAGQIELNGRPLQLQDLMK